ncbi:photosystem I biogenesis protein BtpA [Labilithrix luteola]|uniref:Photosystem I biogenesis protein BtpA n=1 Tax=Labilithrix luteola TaxID=1391654 RepID=A0A0K1Q7D4_9BACT|nr:photosystem I biogenesis protein BtpA [Labilithrix luteola]
MIHLPPLSGSPRSSLSATEAARWAASDAKILAEAGYDAIIVENFGDTPFFAGRVPPVTVAAMTACALAVREAAPNATLGINVLRNDAEAALSIASCVGARFVRVNVHTGARVTDQGIVQGEAASTLRLRKALGAEDVAIWADVDVKHSSPLGAPRPLVQEVEDLTKRGMAEVVLVTGEGTGKGVDVSKLAAVKKAAASAPVLVASGATLDSLSTLAQHADGVVVGSALRLGGIPGGSIDAALARTFATAFRTAFKR